MKRRLASVRARVLLFRALATFFIAAACGGAARAQEAWPSSGTADPLAGTTRKIDDYGKIGHCDEGARLDNFAITLQNEPGAKGYLMVYFGRKDMPAWKDGILARAFDYLVNTRGLDAERVKVVKAGHREERTTELWVVTEYGAPPEPTGFIDLKVDKTKAYQWNEKMANVEFIPDPEPEGTEGGESGEEEVEEEEAEASEAEGEEVAGGAEAEADTEAAREDESEKQWRKEVEKYEIAVVERGVIEDEPEDEPAEAAGEEAEADGEAEGAAESEAATEPAEPPPGGEVKVSLWWDVEKLAEELKDAPGARVSLVFYYGAKNATREKMLALIQQALAKTEEQLGVKREHVVVIEGGRSARAGVELWVVPRGAEPPKPRPGKWINFAFHSAPGEE